MLNFIKWLFYPPVFPDNEDKSRTARYLNGILWFTFGLTTALFLVRMPTAPEAFDSTGFTLLSLSGIMALLMIVVRSGYVNLASITLVLAAWLILAYQAYSVSGIHDTAFIGLIAMILMAGLLLNYRYIPFFAFITIAAGWYFAYVEDTGLKAVFPDRPLAIAQDMTAILIIISLISYFTVRGFSDALAKSRQDSKELANNNTELNKLRLDLERRVDERTAALATTNRQMSRRASQLQAVSDVARAIASVQDIEALLPEITRGISRSFNVYHVGIFLLDEDRQFAVLRASNSEGGQRMLGRTHKLQVGRVGIVGNVAATGQPRVALDTGADAVFFNNPDLPDTHSEMALPLKIGAEIIGVLDVQSRDANAFSPEDVEVLSILANQVAIAIQNARLFSQTRAALEEAEAAFQRYVSQGWQAYAQELEFRGYVLKDKHLTPLESELASPANREALATGTTAVERGHNPVLAIPIKVRGTMIGVMNVRGAQATRSWTSDEINTAQTIADRVAIALENARLVEETRDRAARDRAISDMSNRIGASIDMDNILSTAVRELGRLVPDSDVVIQLGRPVDENKS